jgi:transposase
MTPASVAIAALRSPAVREVRPEDHAQVMRLWAKRHRNLGSARTQLVCGLHAVLYELVPGGVSGRLYASHAARVLEGLEPEGAVVTARYELAIDLVEDLRRIGAQMNDTRKRIAAAVAASKTTLTEIFGVGPIVAATVIGDVVDVSRFANRDHFASYNGTAPIEVSSGPRKIYRLSRRGNRQINHAIHMATTTARSRKERPERKRYARSSGASAAPSSPGCRPTPATEKAWPVWAREGRRGTALSPARPAHTPSMGSSAKPLPNPPSP